MTTRCLMILAVSALALVACGKDNKKGSAGVDENGNCTFETISAFNDIGHKSQMFQITGDASYKTGVQNACAKFKSLIGGGSCLAEDTRTGATTSVSAATVGSMCN